jgi:hypothetical protein
MQHIETVELASAVSSVTLSAIPANYTDLLLVCSLRTTSGDTAWNDAFVRPNSSTSNLSCRVLYGTGSAVASFSESAIRIFANGGGSTANTFGSVSIYLPNYLSATAKSVSADTVSEGNQTAHIQAITAGLWNDTTPISSVQIVSGVANFAIGSSISLYGIKSGSDGIVTVS